MPGGPGRRRPPAALPRPRAAHERGSAPRRAFPTTTPPLEKKEKMEKKKGRKGQKRKEKGKKEEEIKRKRKEEARSRKREMERRQKDEKDK